MGLPGSGKTTLAKALSKKINAIHLNADEVRKSFNDWDFSKDGRLRQANRMKSISEVLINEGYNVVADFVCPTEETRSIFGEAFVIWVNRIDKGRYKDTNELFENPINFDVCIKDGLSVDEEINTILEKIKDF
jgi:adenylylsulfate kinase